MTKKRMLADVLWEAANECLCSAGPFFEPGKSFYSCDAIRRALNFDQFDIDRALMFLCTIGLPRDAGDRIDLFDEEDCQGARYLWLLLAMHVAEDEGIEI